MISISLDFMPAFYTRHLGLKWGEGYYFDPEFRAEVEIARDRFLYEILGRYGVGSPTPRPSPCLSIQPVDLFMRCQGAEWRFSADATVESWGQPWKGMGVTEILALDPRSAAAHPVVDAIIRQYADMVKLHGDKADVLGLRSGTLVIHGPYTTAHQLMGEQIFMLMCDDPDGARKVFAKVWEIYQAILGRLAEAVAALPPSRVNIGDCAASLISAGRYRNSVLPAVNAIARGFDSCVYHSCGPSTHLLQEFAQVMGLDTIQLGPGTDLLQARKRLDDSIELQPLVDPILIRDGGPDEVHRGVAELTTHLQERGRGTLCAWSFDACTPIENVATIFETVAEIDTTPPWRKP